ncbi:MAG: ATP-binding protein [Oscillospiraceae bacterium]|nr:ATP-binding protein [Oscillospiraceae bacterium]
MAKKQKNPRLQTAQEFINVEEIADDFIYSNDGYIFGFLNIRAGDDKLMSEQEQIANTSNLTAAMSGEKEPWQLMSVPRTMDTVGMIEHLMELRKNTSDDAKLKLLNGEIAAIQEMTKEGTKEPLILLKCWAKAARGADVALNKRLHEMRQHLLDNRVSAERMKDRDITYLCKVFADLTTYQEFEQESFADDLPMLPGQKRRLTVKTDNNDILRNIITPMGGLQFGTSRVTIGSVTGRIYGAVRYPAELNFGWAVPLMNASDCVTSITFFPGSLSQLGDALSRSIKRNSTDAAAESDARRRMRLEKQVKDGENMIEQLDYRNAAIGHMTLLVMPFTDNEDNLEDICRSVVNRYARQNIKLKSLGNVQKAAYRQISPYYVDQPEIDYMLRQIMPLQTLIGGSPMTINIYRDDRGYYFAKTMDGGIISLNLLYRGGDRTNGNIFCSGMAGRGKSTALKHIIESLFMAGVKIIVIDPEREFRDLCRNLGGTWLDMGGGTAKINPFQIRPVPLDEDDEEEKDRLYCSTDNAMALHMRTLETFFKMYIPSLTDIQRANLKKTLVEMYQNSGITWDTDVSTLKDEDFPTAGDFYKLLESKKAQDNSYEELAALFYDMAEGADSFLWNGHTNVAVDNDFICFDTNRLVNSSEEVKRAQYFNVLTLCWELMSANRDEPVFLMCDEGYIMLDPDVPQAAMFMRNVAKRGRKYEGMLGFVVQSVVDVLHDNIRRYGQAIIDNSAYKLLFGTDGKNLKETADLFKLTETEQNILLSGRRGKALCCIGSQRLQVDFDIPKYKLELMGKGGGR